MGGLGLGLMRMVDGGGMEEEEGGIAMIWDRYSNPFFRGAHFCGWLRRTVSVSCMPLT